MKNKSKNMSFDIDFDNVSNIEKEAKAQISDELDEDEVDSSSNTEDTSTDANNEDNDNVVVDIDEDDADEEDNGSEDSDDSQEDKSVQKDTSTDEQQENTNDQQVDAEEEKRKEFGDRANKRIRELNAKKKAAEDEAEQIRKEKFEIAKNALETRKELLSFKVEKLKHDYELAIADGDAGKQVALNTELAKIGADLSRIEQEEQNFKEYKPQNTKTQTSNEDDVGFGLEFDSTKAQKLSSDFEFENPRLLTDKVYADTAVIIGKKIMERGLKPDSDEFYAQLKTKLDAAFGVTTQKPVVEKNDTTDGAEKKVVVAKKPPQKVQTVAGGSRTSAPTNLAGNATGKNTVSLTKEDIEMAKYLGQSLKTYASNKAKAEKSRNAKGDYRVELFPDE